TEASWRRIRFAWRVKMSCRSRGELGVLPQHVLVIERRRIDRVSPAEEINCAKLFNFGDRGAESVRLEQVLGESAFHRGNAESDRSQQCQELLRSDPAGAKNIRRKLHHQAQVL